MSPKTIFNLLTKTEKIILILAIALFGVSTLTRASIVLQEKSITIPVRGGTYREGVVGQPIAINPVISSNPVDQDISALIYTPLTDLITNHTEEKEGRIHTIKIKEGLVWSNGQPLTSDDIIFTIKTIQDPNAQSPRYKNWEGVIVERVSEIQIQFTLPSRYTFFENNFAALYIIPAHIYGTLPPANLKLSAYNREPIGNGPYKFARTETRKDGFISNYELRINEKYHGEKPFIERIHFTFYENEADIQRAFKRKEIDGFGSVNQPSTQDPRTTTTHTLPMARYYTIFFNQNLNPLLKNTILRAALHDAIDKERIVQEVWGGTYAKRIESPILRIQTRDDEDTRSLEERHSEITPKIEKIKRREETLSLTLVVPDIDFLKTTAQIIQENWNAVGIDDVNVITLELDELFENVIKANNYEMLLFGNIVEKPLDIFPFWHSSERFYPGRNLALYKSQKADTLMEEIRQEEDTEIQNKKLEELEATLKKDNPAIFLYTLPYTYTYENKLKGFTPPNSLITHPRDRFHNITDWHIMTARVVKKD